MTVKEAKNINLIPKDFEFISDNCPTCKSDLLVNNNLTILECSNIYCLDRVAARAEQMLKNFGVVGVGIQFCKKYFKLFPSKHHTTILLASEEELMLVNGEAQGSSIYRQIAHIITKIWTFDEVVAKLALPDLNQEAYKIFKGICGWETFKYAVEKVSGTIEKFLLTLDGFGSIKARNISNTMRYFDRDLYIADKLFPKYLGKRKSYTICITGYTNFYDMSKSEYVNYVKKLAEGTISIIQKSSFTSDCDYLIAANKYANLEPYQLSNKHNQALAREQRTGVLCILTAAEFVEIILKEKELMTSGETDGDI